MPPLNIPAHRFIVSAILIWILSMRIPIRIYEWISENHEYPEELQIKWKSWMLLGAIASAYPDHFKKDKTYLLGLVVVALTIHIMCEFGMPFLLYFAGMVVLTQKVAPHAVKTIATLTAFFYFSMYHHDHRCRLNATFRHMLFGCVGVLVGVLSEVILRHADLALSTIHA